MKKSFLIGLMLAITIPVFAQKNKSIGKVTFPIGKTFVQSKGTMKWHKIRYFMPVFNQDKIKTGKDARCEVTFQTKKVMRIGSNSISEVTLADDGADQVKIAKGLAWLSIFLPKGTTRLRVRTPSSVCAIRGTVYRLKCDSMQTTYRCYKGTINVTPFKKGSETPADSSFAIGAGEELIVVSDLRPTKNNRKKKFRILKRKIWMNMKNLKNRIRKNLMIRYNPT